MQRTLRSGNQREHGGVGDLKRGFAFAADKDQFCDPFLWRYRNWTAEQLSAFSPNGRFCLGWVGRLTPEKNVRAFAKLESQLVAAVERDFHMLIVGNGCEREWLRTHLHFATLPGFLQGEDLTGAFAQMDAFVFPSADGHFRSDDSGSDGLWHTRCPELRSGGGGRDSARRRSGGCAHVAPAYTGMTLV